MLALSATKGEIIAESPIQKGRPFTCLECNEELLLCSISKNCIGCQVWTRTEDFSVDFPYQCRSCIKPCVGCEKQALLNTQSFCSRCRLLARQNATFYQPWECKSCNTTEWEKLDHPPHCFTFNDPKKVVKEKVDIKCSPLQQRICMKCAEKLKEADMTRTCHSCMKTFQSEWKFNVCDSCCCKKRAEYIVPSLQIKSKKRKKPFR